MGEADQETPIGWSTMLGWITFVIGRALQRYRSGATADKAIEEALRTHRVLPPIEIAARVVWRMMTDPVTDPAEVAMWIATISPAGKVGGVAKA